jgi:hypothetical protein
MERRALVVALALTLPLALYGIPYAYASTTSSDYVVKGSLTVTFGTPNFINLLCNPGDYALSGGHNPQYTSDGTEGPHVAASYPTFRGGEPTTGQTPNGWFFEETNSIVGTTSNTGTVWVVCQSPITVAGIGVPQFGSLYVAIALGAVLYFMMARRFAGRPTVPAQVQA